MPTNSTEMYEKARQLWEEGELDKAEIVYRQLIALDPDFTYAFYDLGVLLKESKPKAKDEIRTYLERFIKLAKPEPELVEQVRSAREAIEGLASDESKSEKIDLTGWWETSDTMLGLKTNKPIIVYVNQKDGKIVGTFTERIFDYRASYHYDYIHKGYVLFEGKIDGTQGLVSFTPHSDSVSKAIRFNISIENENYFLIERSIPFHRQNRSDKPNQVNLKEEEQAEKKAKALAVLLAKELGVLSDNVKDCKEKINHKKFTLSNPEFYGRSLNIFERNKLKKEIADWEKKLAPLMIATDKKFGAFKDSLKDYPELLLYEYHELKEKLRQAGFSW